ncbi:MAG: hypothetical protein WC606_00925 [Candidatus Absconditabacterales bacterium]
MITAKNASKMLAGLTHADRLKSIEKKVSKETKNAIEKKIQETIANSQRRIEFTFGGNKTSGEEEYVKELLEILGYKNVDVRPNYCTGFRDEYYNGMNIKFSIP